MPRIPIVRIDHMTGGTARRTIITWMIVAAEKVQRGIQQARFLQSEINRIGALGSAESARAQAFIRLARIFILVGQSGLQTPFPASFEHPEDVSRLGNFPARQRIEKR